MDHSLFFFTSSLPVDTSCFVLLPWGYLGGYFNSLRSSYNVLEVLRRPSSCHNYIARLETERTISTMTKMVDVMSAGGPSGGCVCVRTTLGLRLVLYLPGPIFGNRPSGACTLLSSFVLARSASFYCATFCRFGKFPWAAMMSMMYVYDYCDFTRFRMFPRVFRLRLGDDL
ncbi:hypothetical protein EDB86DRAFT_2020238 [Lactarius hatsudake]|nr:hypothetical protein EDB86DRAFT_2020238 [Lactarius hatsudake]